MQGMLLSIFCFLLILIPLATTSAMCAGAVCTMKEKEQFRLKEVQVKLLRGLGLQRPPTASVANATIDPRMIEMIMATASLDEGAQQTEKAFVFAEDPFHGSDSTARLAYFNVPEHVKEKELKSVNLHVFMKSPTLIEPHYGKSIEVVVYEVLSDGSLGDPISAKRHSVKNHGRFVDVHIRREDVEGWWTGVSQLAGLFVAANYEGENLIVHPQQSNLETMYLEIEVAVANQRSKRSRAVCKKDEEDAGCCLYDMLVDFKEIGWGFVIAPSVFNAYMCKGDCRYNHHVVESNYAHISKTGKAIDRLGATLGQNSCCFPSEFESTRIIYLDNKNTVSVKDVEGMVARKCSCA